MKTGAEMFPNNRVFSIPTFSQQALGQLSLERTREAIPHRVETGQTARIASIHDRKTGNRIKTIFSHKQ